MGLYLCVFDNDEELEGVEVGSYSDFDYFRNAVIDRMARPCPTLINHCDSDGEWTPQECETLRGELKAISEEFLNLPAIQLQAGWQEEVGALLGLKPASLYESFIDVDGEPLLERLLHLCSVAIDRHCSILFQ